MTLISKNFSAFGDDFRMKFEDPKNASAPFQLNIGYWIWLRGSLGTRPGESEIIESPLRETRVGGKEATSVWVNEQGVVRFRSVTKENEPSNFNYVGFRRTKVIAPTA